MAYHLEKESPYNHKKTSLFQKVASKVVIVLACGIIVTATGRIGNLHLIEKATENYSTTISLYDEVVNVTANFIKENGGEDPNTCFKIYTQLLWNGYFSNGREYRYNIQDKNNIVGNYGARVATGEGDCKNNEDFFCKIMNALGYDAYQVACTQNDSILFSPRNFVLGNHVITVVEYEGVSYYFDTTNACTYEKIGNNKGYNEEKGLEVTLKPFVSYIYGYNDETTTISLIKKESENESSEAYIVDEETTDCLAGSKILVLRKEIEPILQGICSFITKEG